MSRTPIVDKAEFNNASQGDIDAGEMFVGAVSSNVARDIEEKLDDALNMLKRVLDEGIRVGGLLNPESFDDDLEEEARALLLDASKEHPFCICPPYTHDEACPVCIPKGPV